MTRAPDITKIPSSVRLLEWQRMDPLREWSDGQQLLVAVPVRRGGIDDQWAYELDVVQIDCDVDRFRVTCNGEVWGWDLDDADYYVEIHG